LKLTTSPACGAIAVAVAEVLKARVGKDFAIDGEHFIGPTAGAVRAETTP